MSRFPGHIIKLPANTPSQSSAPGVWTLKDQLVAQRNNQWPFQRDPDFRYTTLLLQGNVPNTTGPQAMNLPLAYNSDASSNNFLITPNGDVSPRPFSPYMGSNYSGYFDGASDYVTLPSSADFSFGTADFTIEGWVHPTSWIGGSGVLQIGTTAFPSSVSNSVAFGLDGTPANSFQIYAKNAQHLSAGGYSPNTWHHFALVRSSSTTRLYINGRVAITVLSDTTNYTGTVLGFGAIYGTANFYTGYVSNVRVLKGTAAYTSDFTPAITPFPSSTTNQVLLAFASNRFIDSNTATTAKTLNVNGDVRVTDNSPFVSADFTTGSGYFDGTSDYLTAPSSTPLNLSNGDFTIEAWAYRTTQSTYNMIASQWNNSTAGTGTVTNGWYFGAKNSNALISFNGAGAEYTGGTVVLNQWNHYAVVRQSGMVSMYLNGALVFGPQSFGNNIDNTSLTAIGANDANTTNLGGNVWAGYISDFRIVKGVAVYTGAFTPPTRGLLGNSGASSAAAYPSTTNVNTTFAASATSLLTLQTRAPSQNHGFIDSSPNEFIITRNGNVSQGTFSPFSPTGWSNLFNGSNGITVPQSSAFSFSGEFTWEAFVCFNALPGSGVSAAIIMARGSTASNSAFQLGIYNDPSTGFRAFATISIGSTDYNPGWNIPTPVTGVWYHIAIVRNASNAISCYWDSSLRTLTAGVANAPGTTNTPSDVVSVGYRGTNLYNDLYLNGYLSNVRMTASALYSGSSIQVPTAPFSSAVANTRFLTCQSNRFAETAAGMAVTLRNTPSVQAFSPFAPTNSVSPLVTGGSGHFPGSTSVWLVAPDNPALELGSNDFTIECWVYSTADFSANRTITAKWSHFVFGFNTTPAFYFAWYGTTNGSATGTLISTAPNAWHHLAVCRQGSTLYMFQNGQKLTQSNSTITGTLNNDNYGPLIGGNENVVGGVIASATEPWHGYISGYRIVNGTALYTSSFPVPTAPPTAIPGTSLLLNFTGGGIVDATGKNNWETLGKAQIATTESKWAPGSIYLDGTSGTYVKAPVQIYLGSANFTIEGWVRFPVSPGALGFDIYKLQDKNDGSSLGALRLLLNSSMKLHLLLSTAGSAWNVSADNLGNTLSTGIWYYIAVTRSGNDFKVYVNGSQAGATQTLSGALYAGPINALGWNGITTYSNVYLDDVRLTVGIARDVTASPTRPFPIG